MIIKERLSFAELDFLLQEAPTWAELRARLGFPITDDAGIVAAAGLASLIVRDLMRISHGELMPVDSAAGLATALVEPARHIFLSRADDDDLSTAIVSIAEHPVLISMIAPGCVELLALNEDTDPDELVANIVVSLATEGAVLGIGSGGPSALLVGREGEQWRLGGAPDKQMVAVDEYAVRAGIASVVKNAQ